MLDRYVFAFLPWPRPVRWSCELLTRATYFIIGSIAAYVARLGLVPISEALTLGAGLSIGAFLFESIIDFVRASGRRLAGKSQPAVSNPWVHAACSGVTFLVFFGLAVPLGALHPLRTVPKRTPAVVGLTFEEVHFTTADGIKLTGWLMPHPQARGNVIFCHGHGRNREHGTGFMPLLHELGLSALAFDFRGHGDSDGHTATFGDREVKDLVAAEEFLSRAVSRPAGFLVGVSYGAAVALQALPQLPRVRAVWCEGCFGRFRSVVENQFTWLAQPLRSPLVSAYQLLAWLDCGVWAPDINPIDHLEQVRIPIYFCHG
jgi:hypothetical protein